MSTVHRTTPVAQIQQNGRSADEPRLIIVGGDGSFIERVAAATDVDIAKLRCMENAAQAEEALTNEPRWAHALILSPDVMDMDALGLAEFVTRMSPTTGVVLVRNREMNGLLPTAMRAGIRDFVDLESDPDDLREALGRAISWSASLRSMKHRENGAHTPVMGHLISVFSSKGGSGKTFIASNLAAAIAAKTGQETAVVDLDLGMGDVFSYYGGEVSRPLHDLAAVSDADSEAVFAAATELKDHLWGFGAPPDLTAETLSSQEMTQLLQTLQKSFAYVVVDSPAEYSDPVLSAFDLAEEICLVAALDVVGIRHMSKAIETLVSIGVPDERLRIVLNRADSKVGLDPADVERVMKIKIDAMIPSSRLVPTSLNTGRLLFWDQPRSEAAKAIGMLADQIIASVGGSGPKRPSGQPKRRLLSGRRRK